MKKSLLIFFACLFAALAPSFAASGEQSGVDYDTEIKESESEQRSESKNKKPEKRLNRIGNDTALQKGLVRMETARASGAVLFYVVNGRKIYPAVETSGYGESNYISLFVEAKEYRLCKKGKCKYHFDVDENSITETFTVPKVAELKAVYTIGKIDPKDELENSVSVKYSLKNLTGKKRAFALKAVYNLRLGENRKAHFSSALKSEISSEYVAFPSPEESWVISSDSMNAVEVILYGPGVTPPKKCVLANKDAIEASTPGTDFVPGRSFDSLLSYNNSSLALFWNAVELGERDMASYSYKLNFSTSDFQNYGKRYGPIQKAAPAPAETSSAKPQESAADKKASDDSPDEDIDNIDPSKLNAEYVQQLINHINSLEQSDPSLNRLKIQQLQTEVDEVLQVLRSRK